MHIDTYTHTYKYIYAIALATKSFAISMWVFQDKPPDRPAPFASKHQIIHVEPAGIDKIYLRSIKED